MLQNKQVMRRLLLTSGGSFLLVAVLLYALHQPPFYWEVAGGVGLMDLVLGITFRRK